jgi:hypothetical protein
MSLIYCAHDLMLLKQGLSKNQEELKKKGEWQECELNLTPHSHRPRV